MEAIRSRCGKWIRSKLARLFLLCGISGALVLVLSGASIAKYAVTIEDAGRKTIVYTSQSDPQKLLSSEGFVLGVFDTIDFSGFHGKEGTLQIHRASKVRVSADGTEKYVYISNGTVGDALKRLGISVGEEDLINVSLSEPVNAPMDVVINRVETRTVERNTVIPHTALQIPTQTLKAGKTRVLKEGRDGRKTASVQQTMVDGRVTGERILSETVTEKPVDAEILVGDPSAPTSQLAPAREIELDVNGNPVNFLAKVTGKATAYSSLGRPTKLVPGCVAMDLSKYPRGTRLYIKTPDGSYIYGYSEVRDTGPAVNEGIILVDLFFASYEESCLFGAKTMDIYVLP